MKHKRSRVRGRKTLWQDLIAKKAKHCAGKVKDSEVRKAAVAYVKDSVAKGNKTKAEAERSAKKILNKACGIGRHDEVLRMELAERGAKLTHGYDVVARKRRFKKRKAEPIAPAKKSAPKKKAAAKKKAAPKRKAAAKRKK